MISVTAHPASRHVAIVVLAATAACISTGCGEMATQPVSVRIFAANVFGQDIAVADLEQRKASARAGSPFSSG